MTKINLNDLASLTNEQSALVTINSNNQEIELKSDDFLSRTGVAPNQMEATLDMNSNHLINLPAPATPTEPLRLVDFTGTFDTISDVAYVTMAPHALTSNERVLTAGPGISITDGGAGGNVTITNAAAGAASDGDTVALAALTGTGLAARTAADTWALRTLTAPAEGITITNPAGIAGDPTFALVNDLSAVEGLSSTGLAARTGTDTWAVRTLTGPAAGITVSNGSGAAGNPTLALANDLAALEGLGNGIPARTGTDAWSARTITGTGSEVTVTNGDGVSGNPTISLPNALNFTGKTITSGVYNGFIFGNFAALTNVLTPTALSGTTNDYSPTGFGTTGCLMLRLSSSVASSDLTGLGQISNNQILMLCNVGASNNIVLKDESASSAAANRFALPADITLTPDTGLWLFYDVASTRWRSVEPPSSSGGAPTTAQYVTLATDGTLTNERVLTAGTGISLTDGGAGSTITVNNTGAPVGSQYVTLATDATLTNERVLTAGTGISFADGGAGSTLTVTNTGAPVGSQYLTLATDATLTNERVFTAGAGITVTDGGAGSTYTVTNNNPHAIPGGRLTLTANTPVMQATTTAQTTIRYTPYYHQLVPLFNGTAFVMTSTGGELTQATTDTTKSPAAVGNNLNYDIFVWSDAGTMRATRGPAWSSDTSRGTGAGTTELVRTQGVLLNNVSITNGPAAQRGTYVGSVRSNGSAQIDWQYGALAANGTAGIFNVWNMYNRVDVRAFVQDSTDSYTYTTATIRAANASNTMRVSFIQGLAEDGFSASFSSGSSNNASNAAQGRACGIGYDVTNAFSSGGSIGYCQQTAYRAADAVTNISVIEQTTGHYRNKGDIGFHFVQACEYSDAGGATTTWFPDGGAPTILQNGMTFEGKF